MGSGGTFPAMATRSSNAPLFGVDWACGVGAFCVCVLCRECVDDFYACGLADGFEVVCLV